MQKNTGTKWFNNAAVTMLVLNITSGNAGISSIATNDGCESAYIGLEKPGGEDY